MSNWNSSNAVQNRLQLHHHASEAKVMRCRSCFKLKAAGPARAIYCFNFFAMAPNDVP